ncbi:hypothetical protein DEIGR_400087 [Deinococcus grandis]|uniref:Uncharacterized protein n=1 Tax=Deinococcus grandis TaxID=57498 RepID=A0A117DPT2_9DEIO|nr:hypothetical protein [Deinococcus grandis]GAQ23954.1 hypothetical protein DEIGR_400087 [Deinococcus grandis]
MMTRTITDLASDTRSINHTNGWGTDFTPEQIPTFLALIHSEITEAHQERSRAKRARELGDVIVRALDLCELIRPGLIGNFLTTLEHRRPPLPTRLRVRWSRNAHETQLHALTSAVLERYRKAPKDQPPEQTATQLVMDLAALIVMTNRVLLCEQPRGTTPTDLISGILDANRNRGYRHGGRRC